MTTLRKTITNYFSFGVDARIGYGFDKRRTSSVCCNKCVYCLEGFKKQFIRNPQTNLILGSLESKEERILGRREKDAVGTGVLRGNPVTMLCLNIPSYSGGAGDVWGHCEGKAGVEGGRQELHEQKMGDEEIEVLAFSSILGMGNERFVPGQASRVAQGKGPFQFNFKEDDGRGHAVREYVNFDGEYLEVQAPEYMRIEKSRKLKNGKMQVMMRRHK